MALDSMQEALPLFDVSVKTARLRIGALLPANQSAIALRIGRVLAMAGNLFGSLDGARQYLRAVNFALGGAIPRDPGRAPTIDAKLRGFRHKLHKQRIDYDEPPANSQYGRDSPRGRATTLLYLALVPARAAEA